MIFSIFVQWPVMWTYLKGIPMYVTMYVLHITIIIRYYAYACMIDWWNRGVYLPILFYKIHIYGRLCRNKCQLFGIIFTPMWSYRRTMDFHNHNTYVYVSTWIRKEIYSIIQGEKTVRFIVQEMGPVPRNFVAWNSEFTSKMLTLLRHFRNFLKKKKKMIFGVGSSK